MRKIWGYFFSLTWLGVLVGLGVGLFQRMVSWVIGWSQAFLTFSSQAPWLVLVLASLLGLGAYWIGQKEPSAKGSGVPFLEHSLEEHLPFRYWRTLPMMLINCFLSFFGALPLGSEGPSVLTGGIIGMALTNWRHEDHSDWVAMGAAAGFGSAFLSPLAGWVYCIEETLESFRWRIAMQMAYVALVSWGMALLVAPPLHFSFSMVTPFGYHEIPLLIAIIIGSILLGRLFVWVLLHVRDWQATHWSQRNRLIALLAIFTISGFIALYVPAIGGSGGSIGILLEDMPSLGILIVFLMVRFVMIVFTANSGAAGGLVFPIFSLGLFYGLVLLEVSMGWFGYGGEQASMILLLSMVGIYAVVTKTPWTAAALAITFVPTWYAILPILFVIILIAFLDRKTHTRCLYDELKARMSLQ